MDGGSGFDVAMIDRSDATVNLSFVLSANAVLTNGDVTLKNVEAVQIWSGSGADSLTGGGYADFFDGGEGNDTLKGLGGNDTLHGGLGADRLEGGDGNDMLRASAEDNPDTHADRLYGGAGHDRLFIGQGDFADGGTEVDHIAIDLSD
ncbi:calcium-binding protein, partial [Rhizobiaceae sp. 2RAB30]